MLTLNIAKSALASAVDRGGFLIFMIIFARNSDLETLGLFNYIHVAIHVIINPLAFSLNSTYIRLLAEHDGRNLSQVIIESVTISLVVLLLCFSPLFIFFNYLSLPGMSFSISFILLIVFFVISEICRKVLIGFYIGLSEFNFYLITGSIFSISCVGMLIMLGHVTVTSAFLLHGVASAISTIVGFIYLSNKYKIFYSSYKIPHYETLISYIAPSMLSSLVPAFGLVLINSVIGHQLGFQALGLFAIANQLRFVMAFTSAAIDNVFKTRLVRREKKVSSGEIYDYSITVFHSLRATILPSLFIMFFMIFFLPEILQLFKTDFVNYFFSLFIVAGFLQSVSQTVSNAVLSRSSFWIGFVFNLIWICFFNIFLYILIEPFGLIGISLSITISYIVLLSAQFYYLYKSWSSLIRDKSIK